MVNLKHNHISLLQILIDLIHQLKVIDCQYKLKNRTQLYADHSTCTLNMKTQGVESKKN